MIRKLLRRVFSKAPAAHEPALALYVPGVDPLELAGALAREALEALAPGGLLAIEIGAASGSLASTSALASAGSASVSHAARTSIQGPSP